MQSPLQVSKREILRKNFFTCGVGSIFPNFANPWYVATMKVVRRALFYLTFFSSYWLSLADLPPSERLDVQPLVQSEYR